MKQKKNRSETERFINIRAWRDPAFKKKLLSSPREALESLGMENIPSSLKIKVVEEDSGTWCITLHPAPPNVQDLSDAQLEKILAAGTKGLLCCHHGKCCTK